jgi:hypothetical protein
VRTLVDLLNDERGYARIYADRDGFGYVLSTYSPTPIADLFEQMSGYLSIDDAYVAAQYQLSSVHQPKRRSKRRPRTL